MPTYLVAGTYTYATSAGASSARTAAQTPISTYGAAASALSSLLAGLNLPTTTTVSVAFTIDEADAVAFFNALHSALASQSRSSGRLSLMRLP